MPAIANQIHFGAEIGVVLVNDICFQALILAISINPKIEEKEIADRN